MTKEKLREIENYAELQTKLWREKEEAERVRMRGELELEKQRSVSEQAKKGRKLEAEAFRLEDETQAN